MADAFRTVELSDPRFERDGLRFVTVKSASLGRRGDVSVWAPPGAVEPLPLVILLHGVYGSHWSWPLRGGAHLTAARLIESGELPPLALAMPSDGLWGDGSGYVAHHDADYERWIVDDVPAAAALADERISDRSPLFIAGLSMGGFGALRLGAKFAARFSGISAHSAVTTIARLAESIEEPVEELPSFGLADGTALHWLEAHAARLPPLRFDCGTGDGLLAGNRALHAALDARGIDHVYEEFPGGHDWPYWKLHLADTLRFFGALVSEVDAAPPH
ncbi:MAG TPA: alpha/beta hydrolase-fold protein [Polyangia bacterium]|nr:alpha/beta hydrolase-fold protein [Polyangia bacterium]